MSVVIITSDSHGLTEELNVIKERHQHEADAFVHCGDSELDYHSEEMSSFYKVRGNCDFDQNYPEDTQLSVDGQKIFVTHGHLYQVKTSLMPLSYRAEETGSNIACFGHSHLAGAEKVKDTLFINPGSIREPRGGAAGTTPTYVRLGWERQNELQVEFLNLQGEVEATTAIHL
ncbi:metallophosphoesterase [Salinibacillus aidingensis]|uniref:Phosphoesterase n=1 Tax=Salinibacillus aidingensis TaxID=237684 RepID=A0ABN1ATT6_9BACI